MSFPPQVFARLQPEIYLERHLEAGIRPGDLRKLHESRPEHVCVDGLKEDSIVSSCVIRKGGTTVVCGITCSYTTDLNSSEMIYPNVEILRGVRSNIPSPEEMIISERLYEMIQALCIDKHQSALIIHDSKSSDGVSKDFGLILNAHLQVLSRSGPCFEVCANALIKALTEIKLPKLFIDLDSDSVRADYEKLNVLVLPFTTSCPAKGFTVWNHQLVVDPEGEAEERVLCSSSEISLVSVDQQSKRRLKCLTIKGSCTGKGIIDIDDIKKAFAAAKD